MFTDDFRSEPYWWERTPRPELDVPEVGGAFDVAVVGSGYTGLCAALQVARGGRSTVVFDAEDAGWGCSSRNGGHISTHVKPGFGELTRRLGGEAAFAILKEGQDALAWIGEFVATEGIDCDFMISGRFLGAHRPRHYERLAREIANQPKGLEMPAHMVPRAEQHRELGTDRYFGGVVHEKHASLDPARFHRGLLERCLAAGVVVVPRCPVERIRRGDPGFELATPRGPIRARDVVVATNGYTGALTPWMRRRVIPIGSYVLATEPIDAQVMDRVMPTHRTFSDTRRVIYYYRPSPDRTRIVFGGRVTGGEVAPKMSAGLLRDELVRLLPDLAGVHVSHSWMGFVGYSFDTLAHIGVHEGIHFAMAYCGSGVSMASYLGTRIGQRVLGRAEGRTAFDGLSFPTRPLYSGKPWFLPSAVAWFRFLDRIGW